MQHILRVTKFESIIIVGNFQFGLTDELKDSIEQLVLKISRDCIIIYLVIFL